MSRWSIAFLGAWGICLAGMYVASLVGVTLNCLFAYGCFVKPNAGNLLAAVNMKGVLGRGSLLAIAFIVIAWFSRRKQ